MKRVAMSAMLALAALSGMVPMIATADDLSAPLPPVDNLGQSVVITIVCNVQDSMQDILAMINNGEYVSECDLTIGERSGSEWEVWLSDQSDSYDISAKNPTGTYGSRILIYESTDIVAAPPGAYHEDDPQFAPTVIEAAELFPNAKEELGLNVERLHGMIPHPSHKYMNANFFGPGAGMVGIIDGQPDCEKKVNPTSDLGRAVSSTLQYSWPCAATSGLAPLIVNGLIGAASFLGLAPLWVIAASLPADHKKEVKAKSIIQALS